MAGGAGTLPGFGWAYHRTLRALVLWLIAAGLVAALVRVAELPAERVSLGLEGKIASMAIHGRAVVGPEVACGPGRGEWAVPPWRAGGRDRYRRDLSAVPTLVTDIGKRRVMRDTLRFKACGLVQGPAVGHVGACVVSASRGGRGETFSLNGQRYLVERIRWAPTVGALRVVRADFRPDAKAAPPTFPLGGSVYTMLHAGRDGARCAPDPQPTRVRVTGAALAVGA